MKQSAEDVWRAPAGSDANQRVGRRGVLTARMGDAEAGGSEIARAVFGRGFGLLRRVAQRRVSAGDQALEQRGRHRSETSAAAIARGSVHATVSPLPRGWS